MVNIIAFSPPHPIAGPSVVLSGTKTDITIVSRVGIVPPYEDEYLIYMEFELRFQLTAGSVVTIDKTAQSFTQSFSVKDPSGATVTPDSDTSYEYVFTADVTGCYVIGCSWTVLSYEDSSATYYMAITNGELQCDNLGLLNP
jgi:hypothetical protein